MQEVRLDDDEETAIVIVPDHQLSLAIGKEGQNARLAARLSGYRIDIRSESQELGLDVEEDEEEVEFETVEEGDGAGQPVAAEATDDGAESTVDSDDATEEESQPEEPAAEAEPAADSEGTEDEEPELTS